MPRMPDFFEQLMKQARLNIQKEIELLDDAMKEI
jgi:hypothetical protein